MAYENLFHKEVADGIFLLSTDLSGPNEDGRSMLPGKATTNSYLVVGSEQALLFDLAVDEPGVKEYAEKLAGIPVMLVLSHGHYDHIFHMERFKEAWLHEKDAPLLDGSLFGTKKIEPCPKLHYLKHGDVINLGDRFLDVIHIPGHTPGSILLLDRQTRVLLSGDTGARRFLFGVTPSVSLDVLCEGLEKLKNFPFDVMYSAHDRCGIPKKHIDTMLDVIRNDLPYTDKSISIPDAGTMLCAGRGREEDLSYFDVAVLNRT